MVTYQRMGTQLRHQILATVGANLRAAREARGLTQKDVGDALGVTNRDVSRWENGKVEPGPANRQMLGDLLFDGAVARMYESENPRAVAAAGGMDERN